MGNAGDAPTGKRARRPGIGKSGGGGWTSLRIAIGLFAIGCEESATPRPEASGDVPGKVATRPIDRTGAALSNASSEQVCGHVEIGDPLDPNSWLFVPEECPEPALRHPLK